MCPYNIAIILRAGTACAQQEPKWLDVRQMLLPSFGSLGTPDTSNPAVGSSIMGMESVHSVAEDSDEDG